MHGVGVAGRYKILLSHSSVFIDGRCFGSQSELACLKQLRITLSWSEWSDYLIFSNYFWVTLGGPQVFWASVQKRWCKSSPGLNCSAGRFVRQQHFWSANSIYGVWSGNKWAGSCSRPVSLQPLPVIHASSCHPLFQVLYYRLQVRAGSWGALVTPALVDYGQDSWI